MRGGGAGKAEAEGEGRQRMGRVARRGMFDGIIRSIGDDEKKVTVSRVSEATVIEKRNEGVQRKKNRGLTFSEAQEASKCDRIDPSVYSKCQKFDACACGLTSNRITCLLYTSPSPRD